MTTRPDAWRDARTPAPKCPWCGTVLDCASSADPAKPQAVPKPGDWSLCLRCASPLRFADDLRPRKATAEEEREMNRDPLYARARRAILELDRKTG